MLASHIISIRGALVNRLEISIIPWRTWPVILLKSVAEISGLACIYHGGQ